MINSLIYFIHRFRGAFFSIALIILLSSCLGDDDNVQLPTEVAYVSIYHAVPDAPDLDIIVDGRVINHNPFEYASYSGYLNFFTGSREFEFRASDADNTLIDTTFNFEDGRAYSIFVVNELENVEALLVVDSADAPAAGKAMVRFVNLSPDAPSVEVSSDGSTPLFEPQAFKQASQFVELDANPYTFSFRDPYGDEVVAAEDVDIREGRFYTIVTRGFVDPPSGNTNVLSVEVLD